MLTKLFKKNLRKEPLMQPKNKLPKAPFKRLRKKMRTDRT